jgi:hypothetical protein
MCENLATPKRQLKPANLQVGKGGSPPLWHQRRDWLFSFKVTVRALPPESFSFSDIPLR